MNPLLIPLLSQLVSAAVEIWRVIDNKPPGWEPTPEDWARLRANNQLTAEDYEARPQVVAPLKNPVLPAILLFLGLTLAAGAQTMGLNAKITSADPKQVKFKLVSLTTGTNVVASSTNLQFTAATFYGYKSATNNAVFTTNSAAVYVGWKDSLGVLTTSNTPAIVDTISPGSYLGLSKTGAKYNLADLYFVGSTGDSVVIAYEE